ncbi:MAG TPA: hypothetical protein VKX17_10900 [Planctomycetota bacterium]|nr:hypothetical protein [Planctomycetota bacterium]
MNARPIKPLIGAAAVLLLFAAPLRSRLVFAGEVLVNENFDNLNLEELAAGWSKAEPSELSLVFEDGRGKILRLINKDEKYPFLAYSLDPAKVASKTLVVSAAAKFPGTFEAITDKLWAKPKVLIESLDANGTAIAREELLPRMGIAEWQNLSGSFTIPASAKKVTVFLCIQFVTCEVFFDDFKIEMAAEQIATPVTPQPNPPTANATATNATTPAADPNSPAALAEKAPKRTLEDGGMLFGPSFAKALQKSYPSKNVTANLAMFVGPGFSEKEALPKLSSGWRAAPFSVKLTGALGAPRGLLATLPDALSKEKPEVVFISGDTAPGRKATTTEADDWEDVAKLCMHFGALPVVVMHANDGKDEQYDRISQGIRKAQDINALLALAPLPQDTFYKRASLLLKLLDTHVFLRAKEDVKGGNKPVDE